MVWLTDVSTFVLNMACGFIKNGVPMVKGFKMVQLKAMLFSRLVAVMLDMTRSTTIYHTREEGGFMS
jgi:hypothetical protein